MKRTLTAIGLTLVVVSAVILIINIRGGTQNAPKDASSHSKMPLRGNEEKSTRSPLLQWSMEQKVSQTLYIGIQGLTLSNQEKEMISQNQVGGVILLGRNVESAPQLQNLVDSIRQANANNPTPLFLGIDEEGGRVSRIPDSAIMNLPASKKIGDTMDPELAQKTGRLLAEKVKAFGFNMNFAPVLDIVNNPNNQVIGDRSFGETPERVKNMGISAMQAIQSARVIPVVKHFPGHGNTSVDSHYDLPVVDQTIEELEDFEWVPFKTAVEQGADAIMTAHILFPELDQKYPATLSKTIITGIIREQLDFNGLVITDDMAMGAISNNYGTSEAAVLSIQAGADMVLLTDTSQFQSVKNSLIQAVRDGQIPESQLNTSVTRILQKKETYKLSEPYEDTAEISQLNMQIEEVWNQIQ
ncbi:beta-N-acetylhexosaminidase [Halobacillus halophilus]|uniref:Family 3 glycoside hydrolase n=1 Tax=Halobacillus halophilus (strain ATCC 35676 / DSM 2266 / JCM 20832 / KCTC 3685 / LMG 17431 / NBRC 102448 / NCIMB 2269) TaxID=866895 RepID=I0JST5_HALH3|nr:beta-N-acetylhexosaminidase [Halobacillus halophilus]ASF41130.1 beta-N-acetylhexosaminidase [Halobacillus halophilus]CCG47207.1 family 3 glycoside hydrolase [Halobacillus halophilus DSM 2266]